MARPVVRSWYALTLVVLVVGAIVSVGCRAASPDSEDSTTSAVPAAASTGDGAIPGTDPSTGTGRVASEPESTSGQQTAGNVDEPARPPPQDPPGEVVPSADRDPKADAGGDDAVQGATYTWQDGDRTLTVHLQTELAVQKGAPGSTADVVARDGSGGSIVRKAVGSRAASDELPVFRSESGRLMTLPGGVLLILDPEWSEAQVKSFFSENGIKMGRVSELGYVDNGFFVETEPGFPSLTLANSLAERDGVEVSSPNWSRESVPK